MSVFDTYETLTHFQKTSITVDRIVFFRKTKFGKNSATDKMVSAFAVTNLIFFFFKSSCC